MDTPFLIDLHCHTRLHSACSGIDPEDLVPQALKAGLNGLVITEHHYQWRADDLAGLLTRAGNPDLVLMTGFEYGSTRGDILIYGLEHQQARSFPPGMQPEEVVAVAHALRGCCIAAHPTRALMGFDERIFTLPLEAIEIQSVNLKADEQKLAAQLAKRTGLRPMTASDAHRIHDVGRYATEFLEPVRNMTDLQLALRHGTFRPRQS